jgi:hypothetical protein
MDFPRRVDTIRLLPAVLTLLLLVPLAGCEEDPVCPVESCDDTGAGRFTEVTERSFTIGEEAVATVDNFVGQVTYRTGVGNEITVRATRRAEHRSDLDLIELEMTSGPEGLFIQTSNPGNIRNLSVDLEITAPPGVRTRIASGVGNIDYLGRPPGACRFATGVGEVSLRLPADVEIGVSLRTDFGLVFLGFPVSGAVLPRVVEGTIGGGGDAYVQAVTGVGNIHLIRQ